MLGETFEFVTDKVRYISEKVMHQPHQITVFECEGRDYLVRGYNKPKQAFKFYGGRGLLELDSYGTFDFYLKKFDEHISVEKPKVLCKNLIFGGLMIDFGGTINSRNHITGEKFELTFFEAQGKNISYLSGKGYDKNG